MRLFVYAKTDQTQIERLQTFFITERELIFTLKQDMENEIAAAGRFASVEIVSRHLTSMNNYAVTQALMLPIPNSTDTRKILAKDALAVYRNSSVDVNWHIPFLAPLAHEQRLYHIPLDMFQWPHKIIVRTPNALALPTPGCKACMDIVIQAYTVPAFLWLELVYRPTPS